MAASSIVLLPLRGRPVPKSFMLGECRLRRIKASFLVLALLVAPALGLTTAEVSVMFLAPGDSRPARSHRTTLREIEESMESRTVSSRHVAGDSTYESDQ
jgi:hypothetical protein